MDGLLPESNKINSLAVNNLQANSEGHEVSDFLVKQSSISILDELGTEHWKETWPKCSTQKQNERNFHGRIIKLIIPCICIKPNLNFIQLHLNKNLSSQLLSHLNSIFCWSMQLGQVKKCSFCVWCSDLLSFWEKINNNTKLSFSNVATVIIQTFMCICQYVQFSFLSWPTSWSFKLAFLKKWFQRGDEAVDYLIMGMKKGCHYEVSRSWVFDQ